ncbi:MAG TPA: hypothetical protein VGO53_07900 [Steroidobacteraceae bacterium]|jgi:hypothetical protein|nr:hypothetical protein [Steroidobacteraceae bacterium]
MNAIILRTGDEVSGKSVMEGLLIKQARFYRARMDGAAEPLTP